MSAGGATAAAGPAMLAGMRRPRQKKPTPAPKSDTATALTKVRRGNIGPAVQRFFQQKSEPVALHQLGTTAYGFYAIERTQRIVEATQFPKRLPPDCEPGGLRFRALRRALGGALTEQGKFTEPTLGARAKHLMDVAVSAAALHRLLESVHNGWNPWSEVRMSMGDIALETGQPSTWAASPIDPGQFPWTVARIEKFARAIADRLKDQELATAPDPKRFVADLANAYSKFFGRPAGVSTDPADGSKHGGPFARFAQAATREIGVSLSAGQVRDLLRATRQSPNRGRKA